MYHYTVRYKTGSTLSNADALSRLPRPTTCSVDYLPGDLIHLLDHVSGTTVDATSVKNWTSRDPVLSKVLKFVMTGWPETEVSAELKPYQTRWPKLNTLNGCVLWGSRLIVPPQGRQAILKELHETHPGVSQMKALARSYVWWPKIDQDIENVVKQCSTCQENRSSPTVAPLHPWQWPSQPWSRVHLDFAGPYMGHMFLVISDAHSKWLDAYLMNSITSSRTIDVLRSVFATHGLPQIIVTDNGSSLRVRSFEISCPRMESDTQHLRHTTPPRTVKQRGRYRL